MADDSSQEKTEEPTARRRTQARSEGQVARSQDLNAAVSLFGGVLLLYTFGLDMLESLKQILKLALSSDPVVNQAKAGEMTGDVLVWIEKAVWGVLPMIAISIMITAAISFSQVGVMLSLKPLKPNFSKLNPAGGVKNLISKKGAMRLVMSLGKVAFIGGLAYVFIHQDIPDIIAMGELPVRELIGAGLAMVYSLAIKLAAALLILAFLDFLYQRWQHEEDLKMTKQEVKDEMKNMEGNQQVKQQRKKVARQIAMQRVGIDVPQADVIVTNPTHFSVALKYDRATMEAPKVIAKGADFLALRIRQIAAMNGVPIVERKPVARALYKFVEVGQEVPQDLYGPVAEILAYVYRTSEENHRQQVAA